MTYDPVGLGVAKTIDEETGWLSNLGPLQFSCKYKILQEALSPARQRSYHKETLDKSASPDYFSVLESIVSLRATSSRLVLVAKHHQPRGIANEFVQASCDKVRSCLR